jgi:uncharacterized membrane protein YhaH (DUF805 family)
MRTFEEVNMTITQYLFSLHGRVGRGRWWFGQLLLLGAFFVVVMLGAAVSEMERKGQAVPGSSNAVVITAINAVAIIAFVVYVYVGLAICVKRLHDRGRSGWFLLVSFIPILGLWVFVEAGFLSGEHGANKYGADPRQATLSPAIA